LLWPYIFEDCRTVICRLSLHWDIVISPSSDSGTSQKCCTS
jgi:hypothetical protein